MNEVTNTEVTVIETEPVLTAMQRVEEFVKTSSFGDIVEHIVSKEENVEKLDLICQDLRRQNSSLRSERDNWKNSITDFIKERIKENSVDLDDINTLAEELDIELTKTIRVTFTIEVEGDFTVPIDFDEDNCTSDDFFDIKIDANPANDSDIEVDSEQWNEDSFNVKEIR